jgi:hypothetical protein
MAVEQANKIKTKLYSLINPVNVNQDGIIIGEKLTFINPLGKNKIIDRGLRNMQFFPLPVLDILCLLLV